MKKCSYGWPVRCERDAMFGVYDFRGRRSVPACGDHLAFVVSDLGRSCLVMPLPPATAHEGDMADRSPGNRRQRSGGPVV